MKYFSYFLLLIFATSVLFSQEINNSSNKRVRLNTDKMSYMDYINYHKKENKIRNSANVQELIKEKNLLNKFSKENKINQDKFLETNNIWLPGEFEESQAVLISWPSYAYDSTGKMLTPFMDGKGFNAENYEDTTLYDIAGYETDFFPESPYPKLYSQLVKAIQNECQVWIRLSNITDSTILKLYLKNQNIELDNYVIFNQPEGENSFWTRDCGPYGFYYGPEDSLGLIGALYYPGRPIDNDISNHLASMFNLKYLHLDVETEGGNFMTDGWGRGFSSNVIYQNNADQYGVAYTYKKPMKPSEVDSTMKAVMNLNEYNILNKLQCDGGTGHIDLYLKLLDDERILTTDYINSINNPNFTDYIISNYNINVIKKLKNQYDTSYQILPIALPTKDNGTYPKSCNELFADARTYVNGLTVNKTFIMPIYSNAINGNYDLDMKAVEQMKKYLPGYTIFPIDARALSVGGGEIHCITMQIPAKNPLKIGHKSISGLVDLNNNFKITATARNHSGIKKVILNWKKEGTNQWNTSEMTIENDSIYTANITDASITSDDHIQYYITAESNNGKTAYKPIGAPEGYYTFYFKELTSVNDYTINNNIDLNITPNPVSDIFTVEFNLTNDTYYQVDIFNSLGINVMSIPITLFAKDKNQIQINSSKLPNGTYFIKIRNTVARFVKM